MSTGREKWLEKLTSMRLQRAPEIAAKFEKFNPGFRAMVIRQAGFKGREDAPLSEFSQEEREALVQACNKIVNLANAFHGLLIPSILPKRR